MFKAVLKAIGVTTVWGILALLIAGTFHFWSMFVAMFNLSPLLAGLAWYIPLFLFVVCVLAVKYYRDE